MTYEKVEVKTFYNVRINAKDVQKAIEKAQTDPCNTKKVFIKDTEWTLDEINRKFCFNGFTADEIDYIANRVYGFWGVSFCGLADKEHHTYMFTAYNMGDTLNK